MEDNIIGNQIMLLRKKFGLTQEDLAIKLGYSKQTVSNWETGLKTPRMGAIQKISDLFNVSKSFIIEGVQPSTTLSLVTETTAKLEEDRQKVVLTTAEEQLQEQEQIKQQSATPIFSLDEARARKTLQQAIIPPQEEYPVNLRGILTAGYGSENFDKESAETVYVSSVPSRYDLAFRVAGDSMYPAFEDGEVVFVQETGYIHNGMITAVEIDKAAYLKKIYLEEDSIRLVSLNDDVDEDGDRLYPDIFANEDNEIYIIGKVVN